MMEVKSLQFWEKVQEEYDPNRLFICESSETFRIKWSDPKEKKIIRDLSIEFCGFYIGCCDFLFDAPYNPIGIRIQFIDWCIEKFKSNA